MRNVSYLLYTCKTVINPPLLNKVHISSEILGEMKVGRKARKVGSLLYFIRRFFNINLDEVMMGRYIFEVKRCGATILR